MALPELNLTLNVTRLLTWSSFIEFWNANVFGVAEYLLGLLLLLSVYLRSRSAILTGVVAIIEAVLWPSVGGVASIVAAAALAYVMWKVLYRET